MEFKRTILLTISIILIALSTRAQYTDVPKKTDNQTVKVDLNDTWEFNPSYKGKLYRASTETGDWKEIKVPGEWKMQGFSVKPGEKGIYFRTFTIPAEWNKSTVMLRCDAVFSKADIYINGKDAGSYTGPMMAFEKNISKLVKPGKTNTITIGITAETMADTLMSGTQYAAHQLGGILRKIYLYTVPKTHIENLVIKTDLDADYDNAMLNITADIINGGKDKDAVVTTKLFGSTGEEVDMSDGGKSGIDLSKTDNAKFAISYFVKSPEKWDAEHPNLYLLQLSLKTKLGTETIEKNIGFREIEVVGNQLFVNGKPVKLRGVNRHETHPLLGRSLTPELWEEDAKLFKEANVNYIRTSHYPPAEEFIEWCDSLGLYVELENPLCWIGHSSNRYWKEHDPNDPELYTYLEKVVRTNIAYFRNHPSILMWSMANESEWNSNWSKLADFYAATDSTRPATFHDQAYGGFNNHGSTKMPVANRHYPGPNGPKIAEDFPRPLLFGEYAHLNTYNRTEIVTDPGVRDAWGRGFKKMWEGMYKSRGNLGGAIWSGIDDVFYLPDGKVVGYGEWGPIDSWRRKKPEYYHLKKGYSPVKVHNLKIKTPKTGEPVLLQVENRFDFTNLNECNIQWQVGHKKGTTTIDLAPHQSGILRIEPGIRDLDGKIMTVTFTSPRGCDVETCDVEIGNVKRDNFPFSKVTSPQLIAKEKDGVLTISDNNIEWQFDLTKGKITGSEISGEKVITGGATLMMLSLTTGACKTEHSLNIPFHNETCSNQKTVNTSWKQSNDTITAVVKEEYEEAKGETKYVFTRDGKLTVTYDFTSKISMNPRQWGILFTMSPENKYLKWYRKGLWSRYPADHIGRVKGEAVPFGKNAFFPDSVNHKPKGEWRYDANKLGTNDFRSTKEDIYWASLTNSDGKGVVVKSNGNQAFRAFVNNDKSISVLVTGFSTGGGDMFFSSHYRDERKELHEGSKLKGTVKLLIVSDIKD